MSTKMPSVEARISAQERLTTILHARIEELAQDMDGSFKQLDAYLLGFEQKVDARFDQVDARFNAVDARFDKVDARLDKIEADISGVKTDMGAMEGRILGAFQQLVTMIDTRLPQQGDK